MGIGDHVSFAEGSSSSWDFDGVGFLSHKCSPKSIWDANILFLFLWITSVDDSNIAFLDVN